MKFEIINDKSKVVMNTTFASCIPDKNTLNEMAKAGYKFKLDGKVATAKKICEKLKEEAND